MFLHNKAVIDKFIKIQQSLLQGKKDVCLQLVNELLFVDKQVASSYLMMLWTQLQLHGDNPSSPVVSLAAIDDALRSSIILDPCNVQARIELCKFLYSMSDQADEAQEQLSSVKEMIDKLRQQVLEIEKKWNNEASK